MHCPSKRTQSHVLSIVHKRLVAFVSALIAIRGNAFTIEHDDKRPFRIHGSYDQTETTYNVMDELAWEVKSITGVCRR